MTVFGKDPAAVGGGAMPPAAPDGRAIADALAQLRADGDLQFAFSPPPPPPEPPPAWLEAISRWLASLFGSSQPVLTIIFWGALAVAALLILYWLVPAVRDWVDGLIFRRGQTAEADAAEAEWVPDRQMARNLLAEADALASQGRFAEAVHLLLGRSIEDISARRPEFLQPALTSRAIAVAEALPAPARTAFAAMAAAVERALFARQPIGAGDWQTARTAYERFALRDSWAAA